MLDPDGAATRAQVAQNFYEFLPGQRNRISFHKDGPISFWTVWGHFLGMQFSSGHERLCPQHSKRSYPTGLPIFQPFYFFCLDKR